MDVFVARQPIFDMRREVAAYELLFRNGPENRFPSIERDVASAATIVNSYLNLGLETLTGGKKAFVNISRKVLLSDCLSLMPRDTVVIELLENVEPDDDVIDACRRLKQEGFALALDDFVYRPEFEPLLKLADIIKIDFRENTVEQLKELYARVSGNGVKTLAEKVETQEEFQRAVDLGSSYVQGYFFCEPHIMSARGIPPFKINYLQLLQKFRSPDLDFAEMERLIKSDLNLSYGLLKLVNSAAFAIAKRIESIRQALVILGQRNIRRWVSLLALSEMASDQPPELVTHSLIRASFCESLGENLGLKRMRDDLFLLGMFSMIDAILGVPLEKALLPLPLSDRVKAVLNGGRSPLSPVWDLAMSYEKARWNRFAEHVAETGIDESIIPGLYREAVEWVGSIRV